MRSKNDWKRNEQGTATALGGTRTPRSVQAMTGGTLPDVNTPWLSVECKLRKVIPAWLTGAVDQAKRGARGDRLPIAVLHQRGQKRSDDLVVMRLSDFIAHFGEERLARSFPGKSGEDVPSCG